jgi:hypothetical protein
MPAARIPPFRSCHYRTPPFLCQQPESLHHSVPVAITPPFRSSSQNPFIPEPSVSVPLFQCLFPSFLIRQPELFHPSAISQDPSLPVPSQQPGSLPFRGFSQNPSFPCRQPRSQFPVYTARIPPFLCMHPDSLPESLSVLATRTPPFLRRQPESLPSYACNQNPSLPVQAATITPDPCMQPEYLPSRAQPESLLSLSFRVDTQNHSLPMHSQNPSVSV